MIKINKEDVEVRTRCEKKENEEEAERKKRPEDRFPHSKRGLKLSRTGKPVVWERDKIPFF